MQKRLPAAAATVRRHDPQLLQLGFSLPLGRDDSEIYSNVHVQSSRRHCPSPWPGLFQDLSSRRHGPSPWPDICQDLSSRRHCTSPTVSSRRPNRSSPWPGLTPGLGNSGNSSRCSPVHRQPLWHLADFTLVFFMCSLILLICLFDGSWINSSMGTSVPTSFLHGAGSVPVSVSSRCQFQ